MNLSVVGLSVRFMSSGHHLEVQQHAAPELIDHGVTAVMNELDARLHRIGQHATATCCRACLARWHDIPAGHALDGAERSYVVEAICR